MIDRQEVMELSREFRLSADVVEKDYVLGWVLAGISNHPELEAAWVSCVKNRFFARVNNDT